MCEYNLGSLQPWYEYVRHPDRLPSGTEGEDLAAKFFVLDTIRRAVGAGEDAKLDADKRPTPAQVNAFLSSLRKEDRIVLLLDQVPQWAALGADEALVAAFEDIAGALS